MDKAFEFLKDGMEKMLENQTNMQIQQATTNQCLKQINKRLEKVSEETDLNTDFRKETKTTIKNLKWGIYGLGGLLSASWLKPILKILHIGTGGQ